jgi:murein DD-endopeptidase MepM/ murein hydrolase activator NlpD
MKYPRIMLVILTVSLFLSGCTDLVPSSTTAQSAIVWQYNGSDGYEPTPPDAVVPECGDLMLQLPLRDLSTVEGRLEPGQFRGGNYKPHGAFRTTTATVEVLSALTGYVTAVAAYLQTADGEIGTGEVQYLIDIQHPCGIQVRYDHLKVLSAPLQQVFADNGVTVKQDSRTTDIQSPVPVQVGDVLATSVGLTETSTNYFFDFGVYDFRERQPSKRSFEEYMNLLPGGLWLGVYGTCLYDRFSPENAAALRAIPLGGSERGSDYCAESALNGGTSGADKPAPTPSADTLASPSPNAQTDNTPASAVVVWQNSGSDGFMPTPPGMAVPDCGDLVLQLPLRDLSMVEGRLEPGQFRGGNYKPHGGFRMKMNDVDILSPMSGYIVNVAAYREGASDGASDTGVREVQYMIDIQHPCGIQVRFDHLRVLSAPLQKVFDDKGVVVRDDSFTTMLQPPVPIQVGDVVATSIGHIVTSINPAFDMGVYDFRARQPSTRRFEEYMNMLPGGLWLGVYGTCFYDRFSPENAAAVRAIPLGGIESGSDYCE